MSFKITSDLHILLNENAIDALNSIQIFTVIQFLDADKQQLASLTNLTFKELLSIQNFLLQRFSKPAINGLKLYRNLLKNTAIIPTGLRRFDEILQGGLITGNIYELCGAPASGKTFFILNLVKNTCINRNQKVLIIDTKNDFDASKMKLLFRENETKLENVLIQRVSTKYELINSFYKLVKELENSLKLRLIIIDSLPPLVLGEDDAIEKNHYLNEFANIARYLVRTFHVVLFINNLITKWNPNGFVNTESDGVEKIACGKYWRTVPNARFKIEKTDKDKAKLSVLHSDMLCSGNICANVRFTDDGIVDQ